MMQLGVSKVSFSPFLKNAAMLGFGLYKHTMKQPGELCVRAFVVENDTRKICLVNAELAFITLSIHQAVLNELHEKYPHFHINQQNLVLTAQHTHSAPGGFSYYPLYNMPTPGFSEKIYREIYTAIVQSIVEAEQNKQPGYITFQKGSFELDKEVAFQRSMDAYNANPDIPEKLTPQTLHKGVNREMQLLSFYNSRHEPIGSINWFGVHTTSISNNLHQVNADNKGYAARFLEEHFASTGKNYVAAFAQGICGDVSPRFRYKKNILKWQRGYWYGKYDDDYQSAAYNGRLQFEKALELLEKPGRDIGTNIDSEIWWIDFTNIHCHPRFANGATDARTGEACMGLAFFRGAQFDGPGMPAFLVPLTKKIIAKVKKRDLAGQPPHSDVQLKYRVQGTKEILLETHVPRILGYTDFSKLPVPGFIDGSIAALKKYYKSVGSKKKVLLTPKILPIQLVLLGKLAIAAFPFEITVMAGKRLSQSLRERLVGADIEEVILAPYANGFSGYITTYEEYQVQMYEGGHTVFGQWSLAALQTKFDELAQEMLKPREERCIPQQEPPRATLDEMNAFPFYKKVKS
jgi:hypothetical protein